MSHLNLPVLGRKRERISSSLRQVRVLKVGSRRRVFRWFINCLCFCPFAAA